MDKICKPLENKMAVDGCALTELSKSPRPQKKPGRNKGQEGHQILKHCFWFTGSFWEMQKTEIHCISAHFFPMQKDM